MVPVTFLKKKCYAFITHLFHTCDSWLFLPETGSAGVGVGGYYHPIYNKCLHIRDCLVVEVVFALMLYVLTINEN